MFLRDSDRAVVAATANIPQVDHDKTFAVGVGRFMCSQALALALGATCRLDTTVVTKARIATGTGNCPHTGAGLAC